MEKRHLLDLTPLVDEHRTSETLAGRDPSELIPPDLGALAPSVVGTWHGRMVNEWMSSLVFVGLARQLEAIGEHDGAAEARAFADEERRHGILCGSVVVAAGGEAKAVVPAPRMLPEHRDTTMRAAVVRNVLSIACLSETVAVALIGAEREEMPDGPLRTLLTEIWADEVGHARFGWSLVDRLLPRLTDAEHAAVSRYLPVALRHLEAHELSHLPVTSEPPEEGKTYGVCSGREARSLFADTVNEVIVPELRARGLDVGDWRLGDEHERKVA
jgi:hypothetical protein